jgi:hypothetical protein
MILINPLKRSKTKIKFLDRQGSDYRQASPDLRNKETTLVKSLLSMEMARNSSLCSAEVTLE